MNWNEENIDLAIRILQGSKTVSEACKKMSKSFQEKITTDQLGAAFRRKDWVDKPPSAYTKPKRKNVNVDKVQKDTSDTVKVENTDNIDNDIHITDEGYVCEFEGKKYNLTDQEVTDAILLYGTEGPGSGKTAREVAQYFYNKLDKKWVTERFFRWFFDEIAFTKSRTPRAPHHIGLDDREVMKRLYNRKENLHRETKDLDIIDAQQDIIESLREENEELKLINGIPLDEFEVTRIDARQGSVRHGKRTFVLPLADFHNGKLVEEEKYAPPQNVFNQEVFKQRLGKYLGYIEKVANDYKQEYDSVYIAGLGDYFEAILLNMRERQYLEADNAGMEQYYAVKNAWTNVIAKVLEEFDDIPVKVVIQGGNHDRLTEKKSGNTEEILAGMLADSVQEHFQNEARVDIDFGSAVVSYMLNDNHNLITTHGHHKKVKFKNESINQFINMWGFSDAKWYTVLFGHFHNFQVTTTKDARAVIVPSFCGPDGYNRKKLLKSAPAEFVGIDIKEDRAEQRIAGPYRLDEAV